MLIKKFEDIESWKKARTLNKLIYQLTLKEKFSKDWALRDQIRRASVSVSSNIAEGFDSGFNREFVRFLNISRRSLSEIQNQLYVALDQAYITKDEFDLAYLQSEEIRKMIIGFIKYLKCYNSQLATRNL